MDISQIGTIRYSATVESYLHGVYDSIAKARVFANKSVESYDDWRTRLEIVAHNANPANRK